MIIIHIIVRVRINNLNYHRPHLHLTYVWFDGCEGMWSHLSHQATVTLEHSSCDSIIEGTLSYSKAQEVTSSGYCRDIHTCTYSTSMRITLSIINPSIYPSIHQRIYSFIHPLINLSIHSSTHLFIHSFIHPSIHPSIH